MEKDKDQKQHFGSTDVRERKKHMMPGGSTEVDPVTKAGPQGRKPGTKHLKDSEARTQRSRMMSWLGSSREGSPGTPRATGMPLGGRIDSKEGGAERQDVARIKERGATEMGKGGDRDLDIEEKGKGVQ